MHSAKMESKNKKSQAQVLLPPSPFQAAALHSAAAVAHRCRSRHCGCRWLALRARTATAAAFRGPWPYALPPPGAHPRSRRLGPPPAQHPPVVAPPWPRAATTAPPRPPHVTAPPGKEEKARGGGEGRLGREGEGDEEVKGGRWVRKGSLHGTQLA